MQCAHCATPVPDDARFCQSCGSQVSDAEGQASRTASMDGAAFAHLESLLREDTQGEFVVERMLGRGGMAVVYLATEVHLSRKVALKVLPPELTFGHGVERFKREARTAAALDHPNIIPVYRVASGGKIFWYAMKYLEGRALDEILKERGQFGLDETLLILGQVADALDYAHEHQVVHRDIKPANVMLDNRDRVIVTDFGIAKALTEGNLTASGSIIGTPYYMSPEQGMGKAITGAADQYSVAVMAYRMLAGEVPFEGDSAIDILHKHCMVPPPPLQSKRADLPPHVYVAVHRALNKDPKRRFATVSAFVQALTTAGGGGTLADSGPTGRVSESELATMVFSAQELSNATGPGRVVAPPAPAPPVAAPKRRRWIPAVLGALVLVGGAVTAWQLTSGNRVTPADAGTNPAAETAAVPAAAVPAPQPTTGMVQLSGVPANATITAGGARQAGTTFEMAAGNFQLRIDAPDYDRWTQDLTLTAGDTMPVAYGGRRTPPPPTRTADNARRQPAQAAPPPSQANRPPPEAAPPVPMTIRIGTVPVDATVFLDGEELPAARLREAQVLPGRHGIRIVHPTAGTLDTTVTVDATMTRPLIFRLGS